MPEITLDQIAGAKLRRDRAAGRIASLKREMKDARADLADAEGYYDGLVSDLCSGQARLPLGEHESPLDGDSDMRDAIERTGIDLVTSRPGSTPEANGAREPVVSADGKVTPPNPRQRRATATPPPAVKGGRRRSAMLPEGRQ